MACGDPEDTCVGACALHDAEALVVHVVLDGEVLEVYAPYVFYVH